MGAQRKERQTFAAVALIVKSHQRQSAMETPRPTRSDFARAALVKRGALLGGSEAVVSSDYRIESKGTGAGAALSFAYIDCADEEVIFHD